MLGQRFQYLIAILLWAAVCQLLGGCPATPTSSDPPEQAPQPSPTRTYFTGDGIYPDFDSETFRADHVVLSELGASQDIRIMVYDCADGVDCASFGCIDPPFRARRAAIGARFRTHSSWEAGDSLSLRDGLEFVWAANGPLPTRPSTLEVDVDALDRDDGSAAGRFRFRNRDGPPIDIPFDGVFCGSKVIPREQVEPIHQVRFTVGDMRASLVPPNDLAGTLAGWPFEVGHASLIRTNAGADLLLFSEEVEDPCQGPIGEPQWSFERNALTYEGWVGSGPPPDYFRIQVHDSEQLRAQGAIAARYGDGEYLDQLSASVHWFEGEGSSRVTWSKDWAAAVAFDLYEEEESTEEEGGAFFARIYLAFLDPGKSFVVGLVQGKICDHRQ